MFSPSSFSVVVTDKKRTGIETVSGVTPGATSRASAMVFEDPVSLRLKADLHRIAPSDATVLIIGETGTGKELVARYIHAHSARKDGPFLAVNCGAFSETLVEAELFGHEKGAFTGAARSETGWFEAAHGGTLLLDEIGDLPPAMQVKLLRVLQEREIVRVGSRKARPIDVRLIAATNVNLEAAVAARSFRKDLFYRLAIATVNLAPLRVRRGDIEPLANYFLRLYGAKLGRPMPVLAPEALAKLTSYHWPGNIRELENVLHNALLLTQEARISDVPIVEAFDTPHAVEIADFEMRLRDLLETAITQGEKNLFDRVTRSLVSAALDLERGNQVHTAERLGMSRNELRTHLGHMGVIAPRKKSRREQDREEKRTPARSAPNVVRLGFQKFGTLAALRALGSLDERLRPFGYHAEWREFSAGSAVLDAIGRGEIDIGVTGEAATVFALAMGVPFYYVGYESPAPTDVALVVADPRLRSIDDLRGKRVAFSRWSNADHFLTTALNIRGLSCDDIEPVYVPPTLDLLEDLHDGAIDAWAIWEPLLSAARMRSKTHVLLDGSGFVENHQFYVARRHFACGQPQIVDAILAKIRSLGATPRERAEDELGAVARCLHLDRQVARHYLHRLDFEPKPLDRDVIGKQQSIADGYFAAGQLPARVSIEGAVWRGA
jgi:DNA-binding NtrC family response regulator/ABC-type nitrate/sulfonate/bicarbonate transport system substrate-binding protein